MTGHRRKEDVMAYMITEDCIACGACESECPNDAISEGEQIFVIDPDKCTECVGAFESSQCAGVCPVDACVPNPDRKETKEELLEKWRQLHPGKDPAPGTY
ncbi:MAG: YfhL family 4Fe-4S dicluster ferredoxin [Dehalococcoidia bacterium]